MKAGWIGAGKVGVTFGRYFQLKQCDIKVMGYYSRSEKSASEAAIWTRSKRYSDIRTLVEECQIIFITVPDDAIVNIWKEIKEYLLDGKIICHCSGLHSSAVFSEIEQKGAYGYSIHPLFAVSSKEETYLKLEQSYITLEGHPRFLEFWKEQFSKMGNPICVLEKEQKVKYHAAAVFSSNFVVGLFATAQELLVECGFEEEAARQALLPLFINNANAIGQTDPVNALTGPLERADVDTMKKHLMVLSGQDAKLYQALSEKLLTVAKKKNPERNYEEVKKVVDIS